MYRIILVAITMITSLLFMRRINKKHEEHNEKLEAAHKEFEEKLYIWKASLELNDEEVSEKAREDFMRAKDNFLKLCK